MATSCRTAQPRRSSGASRRAVRRASLGLAVAVGVALAALDPGDRLAGVLPGGPLAPIVRYPTQRAVGVGDLVAAAVVLDGGGRLSPGPPPPRAPGHRAELDEVRGVLTMVIQSTLSLAIAVLVGVEAPGRGAHNAGVFEHHGNGEAPESLERRRQVLLWRSLAVLIVVGGVLGLLRLVVLLLEDAAVPSVAYQVVLLALNVLVGLVVAARLRSLRRR
jgi:hypothetical protein